MLRGKSWSAFCRTFVCAGVNHLFFEEVNNQPIEKYFLFRFVFYHYHMVGFFLKERQGAKKLRMMAKNSYLCGGFCLFLNGEESFKKRLFSIFCVNSQANDSTIYYTFFE